MGIGYGMKALSVTSFICGFLALVTCFWTFGSMIAFYAKEQQKTENKTKEVVAEFDPDMYDHWAQLTHVSHRFRIIMYTCLWIAIFGLLAQMTSALGIFFWKDTKIWNISKYFVGVHFGVFVVLLCCLFVPVSEDKERFLEEEFSTFNDYIMDEFASIGDQGIKYIVQEFHAYYIVLGGNIAIIFFCMVIVCCLLRCETRQEYDSV